MSRGEGRQGGGGLDDVINKLDYTFIDLPELIDASDDEVLAPEPEPVYTASVHPFAVSNPTHHAHTQHHQQHHQQHRHQANSQSAAQASALSGSYWQQLQQFNSNAVAQQQPGQLPSSGAVQPGGLGAALLQAMPASGGQQQQQYQHIIQQQQQMSQSQQQQMSQSQQQQGQQQLGAGTSAGPLFWGHQPGDAADSNVGGMDEG